MENKDNKIQELQILEQNLHNLLLQKQAFQMELSESNAALKEIEKSGEDVYKVIGQLMIKRDKNKTKEELKSKEKMFDLRIKTIEKQETTITEKLEHLRDEVMKGMNK